MALPAYVLAHAGDANQVVPYLIELNTTSVFRWTDFGRDILANGVMWTAAAVRVSGLSLTTYDSSECQIDLGDAADAVAAIDLSTTKGIAGSVVRVYECWLDPTTFAVQALVTVIRGRVEQVTMTDSGLSFVVGPYVNLAGKPIPRWRANANCPYVFKDSRCQYTGVDVTCAKTWADCGARTGGSRQAFFGGFRNLPKPNTKIVWANGAWTLVEPK